MKLQRIASRLALAFSFGLIAGCAGDQTAPLSPGGALERVSPRSAFLNVNDASSPSYPEAAIGADPHPSNPGLWLGIDVTPSSCFRNLNPGAYGAGRADNDKDWLYDDCEFKIASGFRPYLFSDGYCMGGEPYYAVKHFYYPPQNRYYVRVMYQFSYYDDCGYVSTYEPGADPGDGEYMQVNFAFDGTSHWLFHSMSISDHGEFHYYDWTMGWPWSPRVTYGGRSDDHWSRKYPNVWVSHGKHANFVDEDQCEAIVGSASPDRCVGSGGGRVFVDPTHNVGEVRADGSVFPMNPANPFSCYLAADGRNGKEECFLSHQPFNGWYPGIPDPNRNGSAFADFQRDYSKFWDAMSPETVYGFGPAGFGPTAPPPLVYIDGPSGIAPYRDYTWTAQVNGVAPVSFQWYVDGSPAETSQSIVRSFPPNETHQLQVVVSAGDNTSNSAVIGVQAQNECPGGGPCDEWFSVQGQTPAVSGADKVKSRKPTAIKPNKSLNR